MGRTSPALKMTIPTVLVEDEPMQTECAADKSNERNQSRRKEGRGRKSKKGRSVQPRSPDEGRSYFIVAIDKLLQYDAQVF